MPTYADAEKRVTQNLTRIASGERASIVAIGEFTLDQLHDINVVRRGLGLHELENPEILYIGKHHHRSRSADGYSIADMWLQIASGLSPSSIVIASSRMTSVQATSQRADGYGNMVTDRLIFEMSQRKPRAELYSAIPKGDVRKPDTQKAHPEGEPPRSDPG